MNEIDRIQVEDAEYDIADKKAREGLENKADKTDLPTKTSELENDSGFLTGHQSLDDYAKKTEVPTKTSQLENDSGFITNAVENLINYYLKSETYSKEEIKDLIGQIKTISILKVEELPETGESNVIYLEPKEGSSNDIHNEYIYINEKWELIGSTQIDLTGYAKEDWVNIQIKDFLTETQVNNLIITALSNHYTKQEINAFLNNKVDKENGKGLSSNDFTNQYKEKLEGLKNYDDTEIKEELSNKADKTDIPDTSNFITKDVSNLSNYYNKDSINEMIGDIEALLSEV